MDGRRNNGGHSTKGFAGRKPKADEIKLIERLDNIIDSDDAIKQMLSLIQDGNLQAIKLYMEYRFGKPKESLDVTSNQETISIPLVKFITTNERDKS